MLYRAVGETIAGRGTEAVALARDLNNSASKYIQIGDFSLWPNDFEAELGADLHQSIEELKLFRVSQGHPLLLNAIELFTPREITRTFRAIANFSYRYFIIGNQSPGNLERVAAQIAHDIRSGRITNARGVGDALRAINPDATFRDDFVRATVPKSKAKVARYTLAKIENYRAQRVAQTGGRGARVDPAIRIDPNARGVSLEHVLPQSIPGPWRARFSRGVDPTAYVYRIGNLTLMRAAANRDLGDLPLGDKLEVLRDSQLQINLGFRTVLDWTDVQIEVRQAELAADAPEIWRV